MEREPIDEEILLKKNYFEPEFNGQNIKNSPLFKKWYKIHLKKIKIENERRSKINANNNDDDDDDDDDHYIDNDYEKESILCIYSCPGCFNYSICIYEIDYSFVECKKCKTIFCPGCNHVKYKNEKANKSLCLKGCLLLWWLRVENCRSGFDYSALDYCINRHFFFCIFCIFLTPIYLGCLSFIIGIFNHPKIHGEEQIREKKNLNSIHMILFGLSMFPYIITFIPIMVLLLIPGILNYDYYIYLFNAYATAAFPGCWSYNFLEEDNKFIAK